MQGIGPPLVTPFDEYGNVEYDKLAGLVSWVEQRGIDFLVPCGSTSEAELLTNEEQRRVIETVAEEASVPVMAGAGHPGLQETRETIERASAAGVEGVLVVTPFYYDHGQDALAEYYEQVAQVSDIPIYLYSVPQFTGVRLEPETVAEIAEHPNIFGMKDSAGSLSAFTRTMDRVRDSFDMLIGSAGILAQALDAGASGGICALANLAPEALADIVETQEEDPAAARGLNRTLVELDDAVTSQFGIPGLKYAMRERGAPAGYARTPHRPPSAEARERLDLLLARLE